MISPTYQSCPESLDAKSNWAASVDKHEERFISKMYCMDFLRVGCMLGSVIGGCVAQVGNHCPSSPVPTNTSQQNQLYVDREIENELCFYDPSEAAERLPCLAGYYRLVGRPCFPCPYDENGIKTYQPQKNSCSKCILCRDCEKEGMEEASRCTRQNNTVCQKRSFQPTDKYYPTTEAEEEDTHPSSSTPSSPVTEKIPLQDEMAETGDTDEDNLELEKLRKQITLLHWIVGITVSLLVICLAGYASYKLIKYKLRKHCKSSSTGNEQNRNQNSGHSRDSGEESTLRSDEQDRNQNSGHSRDPGEGSSLMPGEEQHPSVETDVGIPLEDMGQTTETRNVNDGEGSEDIEL